MLVVLCYVPIWYAWRASQQRSSSLYYFGDNRGHGPVLDRLSAATQGHVRIVGPFLEIERYGISRNVNHQLLTFWTFEQARHARSPRTHAWFRAIYNRHGPRLAARIRSPWTADLAYLMLKPIELLIRVTLA